MRINYLSKKAIDLVKNGSKKTACLGLVTSALACSFDADMEASFRIRPVLIKIERQISPSDNAILAKYNIIEIIGSNSVPILEDLDGTTSLKEILMKLSENMDVIDDQVELPDLPEFFDFTDVNESKEEKKPQKSKEPYYVSYINKKRGKNKYK